MKKPIQKPKLILEEKKAITLFLWLFYTMFIFYDIYYYLIRPVSQGNPVVTVSEGLGLWLYVIILGILPFGIYFIKKGNPYIVKYIYIYSYIIIDLIHNLLIYYGSERHFTSGNIVELLFLLFSPIFINKRYFWTVSIGMIGRDVILGVILQDLYVLFPIVIFTVISIIAYILLARFYSYINSLTNAHEELRQNEKLAVIGQMAAAIAHEIRNPLSSLKGFTQLQEERNPHSNDFYPIMIEEIDRINSIVNDLMYLGKPRTIKFEKDSIEEIIAYTLSITQQQAERQRVTVETMIAGPLPPLECDEKQLKQVFINLIKNAIESMTDGGSIKINVKVLEGHKMYISIQDEGCGIEDKDIINLGEPFFTTKQDGTGLGLMVTDQIIKEHLGEFNIQSDLDIGTKVEVILPIVQRQR